MGDRGNIAVQDGGKRVYLYGHWSGSDMPETLRTALVRGEGRWNDPPYLARIIFCELVKGSEMDETGFGISTTIGDNEHPIIVVDCDKQMVTLEAEPDGSHGPRGTVKEMSFKDYAALEHADFGTLDEGHDED